MKIQEIQIDNFGAWQNLYLPLRRHGLNVIYGANEAGKSTLMRFIRGVCYGFPEAYYRPMIAPDGCQGSLVVEHAGQECEIQRFARAGHPQTVTVKGFDGRGSGEEQLNQLLRGVNRRVFESVFAIGLAELQELAALDTEELSQMIHGLTLGPQGHQLQKLTRPAERRPVQEGQLQSLIEAVKQQQTVTSQLDQFSREQARHVSCCREQQRLQQRIHGLQEAEAKLTAELQQVRFYQRVRPVWERVRECESRLHQCQSGSGFTPNPQRLAEIEKELQSLDTVQELLETELRELRHQQSRSVVSGYERLQLWVAQQEWIASLETHRDECLRTATSLKKELDHRLGELGPDWNLDLLERIPVTPESLGELQRLGGQLRKSLRSRLRLRKKYEFLSESFNKRSAELARQVKLLGGVSIPQAIENSQKRINHLQDLGRLKLRETELEHRRVSINEQASRTRSRDSLPQWVYVVLGMFGVVGLTLACLGFYTGVTISGIAGLIYFLLGITGAGMAWGLKSHFEGESHISTQSLRTESVEVESRLRETRQAIQRITASHHDKGKTSEAEADLIAREVEQLTRLQQLKAEDDRLTARRRRLSKLRGQHQLKQRSLNEARQTWCAFLQQYGFEESLKVNQTIQYWQQIIAAGNLYLIWQQAQADLQHQQKNLQHLQQEVHQIGEQFSLKWNDNQRISKLLHTWQSLPASRQSKSTPTPASPEDLTTREQELRGYQQEWHRLNAERELLQAGLKSRQHSTFDSGEYSALRDQYLHAEQELQALLQQAPDVTVLEAVFQRGTPEGWDSRRLELELQLEQTRQEREQTGHTLRQLEQELSSLEQQRELTALRFEQQLAGEQLQEAAEDWLASQMSHRALEQMQGQLERNAQPSFLQAASEILARMTRGQFRNLWSPLGEKTIHVDDDHDRSYKLAQLSGGTQEQVFLAIRLALVREFSRRGIELPVVLDDVIVNFDQHRTSAVADTLIEFAGNGQQILLFTCHQHLAELFRDRGQELIRLPERKPSRTERVAS